MNRHLRQLITWFVLFIGWSHVNAQAVEQSAIQEPPKNTHIINNEIILIPTNNIKRIGNRNLLDSLKVQYAGLMEEIASDLANEGFVNVTGIERTTLIELSTITPEDTEEAYNTAIYNVVMALSDFRGAKFAYDAFVEAKTAETPELIFAAEAKSTALIEAKAATATTAKEATEFTAAIITALRAYYESHALAEGVDGAVNMTDKIRNPKNPTNTNRWTVHNTEGNCNMHIMSNEPYTNADGTNASSYFESNSLGSAFSSTFTQNISLTAGEYILTAKARGNGTTTYQLIADGQSIDINTIGIYGGVFDYGWNDYTVRFVLRDDATITIGMNIETGNDDNWLSFSDFRLIQLQPFDNPMANDDDYDALSEAIKEAERNILGFDADEYAPYENIEAMEALANAYAIDQEIENDRERVQTITEALTEAIWIANTKEVNAVYDGDFALQEAHESGDDVELPWWVIESGNTCLILKDVETYPALADAKAQTALFVHPGTYIYGDITGYTMPLDYDIPYLFSAKYCSWEHGSNESFTVVIMDEEGNAIASESFGRSEGALTEKGSLKNIKFSFTPTADANYLLAITVSGNTAFTDLKIMKDFGILGDVNGDEEVNVADVTALVNIICGAEIENGELIIDNPAADVDCNNTIDADDIKSLISIILANEREE